MTAWVCGLGNERLCCLPETRKAVSVTLCGVLSTALRTGCEPNTFLIASRCSCSLVKYRFGCLDLWSGNHALQWLALCPVVDKIGLFLALLGSSVGSAQSVAMVTCTSLYCVLLFLASCSAVVRLALYLALLW